MVRDKHFRLGSDASHCPLDKIMNIYIKLNVCSGWCYLLRRGQLACGCPPPEGYLPSFQLLLASRSSSREEGPHAPLSHPGWNVDQLLVLYRSFAGNHGLCEFMSAATMPMPEDSISQCSSPSPGHSILLTLSSMTVPEAWAGCRCGCPLRTECPTVSYSYHFDLL